MASHASGLTDFDLVIIVNDKRLTDRIDYWSKADDRLISELSITKTLRTPVTSSSTRCRR